MVEIKSPSEPNSASLRTKQPFPLLPSFAIVATIIQYFDYKDEVKFLFQRLSNTSRHYFISHNAILKAFLTDPPTLKVYPFFGS